MCTLPALQLKHTLTRWRDGQTLADNRMSDRGLAGAIRALHHPNVASLRQSLGDQRPGSREVLLATRRVAAQRHSSVFSTFSDLYVPSLRRVHLVARS